MKEAVATMVLRKAPEGYEVLLLKSRQSAFCLPGEARRAKRDHRFTGNPSEFILI